MFLLKNRNDFSNSIIRKKACFFGLAILLVFTINLQAQQNSVRFYGNGINAPDLDRIKIQIDNPSDNLPGPSADIGDTDFTIEFWIKGNITENTASGIECGANNNWINGNIIIDRDRYNQGRNYGISLAGGIPVFGVMNEGHDAETLCGATMVLDGDWHHLAFQRQRSNGLLSIFVDGTLEAMVDGPDGDVSYPDNGIPTNNCGPSGNDPCDNSDPYIVLGAEKHDAGINYPSFNGFMEELRLSNTIRYSTDFLPELVPFVTDGNTMALYHFDETGGLVLNDVSDTPGGPSNGTVRYGGNPLGPEWINDSPFSIFLSVDISAFEATPVGRTVRLDWSTESENGSSHFEIEKSEDAINWTKVTEVPGAGDSTDPLSYSWTDNQPFIGINYYRIKMVDITERFSYTSVAAITVEGPEAGVLVFPNPVRELLHVLIAYEVDATQLKLYNSLGQNVTPPIMVSGPYYLIHTEGLYTGIHWLVIERENTNDVVLVSVMR
ncbi:MAG: LamG-like jellyroll fold domain-containing protein [Bacteroidota bacterium]